MSSGLDSQNQEHNYGGDDSPNQSPKRSVSSSPIESPIESPRRSRSLHIPDNHEHALVLVNVQENVSPCFVTSNIKEGLTFFKSAPMPEGSMYGLPITCDSFTVDAKTNDLRGWLRTTNPSTRFGLRRHKVYMK